MNRPTQPHVQKTTRQIILSPILSRHLSPAHHPQATASQRLTNCVAQNAIRDRMAINAL